MAKLLRIIEKSSYSIYTEIWILENNLKFDVAESYNENSDISISSASGDIGDQIFERMIKDPRFKNIELIALGSYFIRIDKSLVPSFMDEIEKIDLLSLKEGKTY